MDPEFEVTSTWLPAEWQRVLMAQQQRGFTHHQGMGAAERCLLHDAIKSAASGFHSNQSTLSSFSSEFHGNMAVSLSSSSPSPLPDWFSLLNALMTRQTDKPRNEGLCRFLQLPTHLQRTILGLVSHHALEIPLPLLQKFTRDVQDCKLTDHWSLFHLHSLQNHIATHLPGVEGQGSHLQEFMGQRSMLQKDLGQSSKQPEDLGQNSKQPEDVGQSSKQLEGLVQSSKHVVESCQRAEVISPLRVEHNSLQNDFAAHPSETELIGRQSKLKEQLGQSSKQLDNTGQRAKVNPLREGCISERSRNLFHNVCKSVNTSSMEQHDSLPQCLFPEYSGMKCFVEYFEDREDKNGQGGQNGQDVRTKEDVKMTITSSPTETQPLKRKSDLSTELIDLEQKQSKFNLPVAVATSSTGGVLVQPPPVLNHLELEGISDVDVLPEGVGMMDVEVGEQAKQTEKMTLGEEGGESSNSEDVDTDEPSVAMGDEQSFINELGDELKVQLNQMKSSLHGETSLGATELQGCSEAIKLMGTCTPSQLSTICDFVDLASVTMAALPAICQSIIPLSTLFSFKSSVLLAERLFLGKISSLTHNAPRVLTTSLMDFAKTFPKPAVEGVLTTSLLGQGSLTFQVDLVSKVTKDALSIDLKAYLLRSVLAHADFVWSEPFSGFVQGLVDAKLELDSSLLGLLTSSLAANAAQQAHCKKFAKLLLATINKFCKQLNQDHVSSLQRAVELNQTFLKKACQNALKKIKL